MQEEMEVWKDVVGYEGLYQVSNKGRVKSLKRLVVQKNGFQYYIKERILPGSISAGYPSVGLVKDGKCKYIRVHRLVAEAFIPNPNNYKIINHKDCGRTNNCVENLEWCTQKYNIQYAVKHGAFETKRILVKETGEIFDSIHECARQMKDKKVDFRHVSACARGKLKSHAGFHFVFADECDRSEVVE